MHKLKILFITNRVPYPIVDGQSRRTYNILRGLSLYFDIYFLSLAEYHENKSELPEELTGLCEEIELFPCPSKLLSFQMILRLLRSFLSLLPYTVWRHHSKDFIIRFENLIKNNNFDIIHCDCLPLASIAKRVNKVKKVLTDHDVSYIKYLRMARKSKNIIYKILLYVESYKVKKYEKYIFKKYDANIVVSDSDKNVFLNLCPDANIKVVENGVDTDEFIPDYNNCNKNELIWLGGFGELANVEAMNYFIENIYGLVKENVKDVKLSVVGGNVPKFMLDHSTQDTSINYLGFVDNPVPFIQHASLLVAPILSGGGTRLKILEAMSMGKAIVSTSIGVEGIEAVDGEHFLIADSPREFAEKVCAVLADKKWQEKLGNSARELVKEKYDWKIIWEKNLLVYSGLVNSNAMTCHN